MDVESSRERRARRRQETRRRRRRAGLLAIAIVAVAVVAIVELLPSSAAGTHRRTLASDARSSVHHHSAASTSTRGTAPVGPGDGRPGTEAVPILMYHVIAAPPAHAPFPGLYVTASELAAQMRALKDAGWHAVTPDQVAASWRDGASLGHGKPIVLSFDNGYESQYTRALPVLHNLGWVGVENMQLTGLPPSQGGLSQRQIRGLIAAGWELDTQGFSHADLITLDAQQLRYQVATSRRVIQQRYHVPANWFCYPSGHYDAAVIAAVKAAGYAGSTTVVPGWAHRRDDPYRLPRLRVLGGTTPQQLLNLVAAARRDPPAPPSYNGT